MGKKSQAVIPPIEAAEVMKAEISSFTSQTELSKAELALDNRNKALDKAGVTQEFRFAKLKEGLEAYREITEIDDMGEPVVKRLPDHGAITKYLEMSFKLSGEMVEVKTEVNVDNSQRTIKITASEAEELARLRGKVFENKNESHEEHMRVYAENQKKMKA